MVLRLALRRVWLGQPAVVVLCAVLACGRSLPPTYGSPCTWEDDCDPELICLRGPIENPLNQDLIGRCWLPCDLLEQGRECEPYGLCSECLRPGYCADVCK